MGTAEAIQYPLILVQTGKVGTRAQPRSHLGSGRAGTRSDTACSVCPFSNWEASAHRPEGSSAAPQMPEQTLVLKAASSPAPQHHVQAVTHQGHRINTPPRGPFPPLCPTDSVPPQPFTLPWVLPGLGAGAMKCWAHSPLPAGEQRCSARNGPPHVSAQFCTSLQWLHFPCVLDMNLPLVPHPILQHLEEPQDQATSCFSVLIFCKSMRLWSPAEFWSLKKRSHSVSLNHEMLISEIGAHRSTHLSLLLTNPVLMLLT